MRIAGFGLADVEGLPGHRLALEHFLAGELDQVAGVAAFAVPFVAVVVSELGEQHGGTALGQEQERKAGGNDGVAIELVAGVLPGAVGFLDVDKIGAADAIPVLAAEVALAGEPAGALDAVHQVKERGSQSDSISAEGRREMIADPIQAGGDGFIILVDAAILGGAVVAEHLLALGQVHAGNDQAADASRGHGHGRPLPHVIAPAGAPCPSLTWVRM